MRGVTKSTALQFERAIIEALTSLFGQPTEPGSMLEWTAPAMGGSLSFHLVQDSKKAGAVYRARTLFCRYSGMLNRYGTSGKNNFHSSPADAPLETINACLWHIRGMLEASDRARFDELVKFQTKPETAK